MLILLFVSPFAETNQELTDLELVLESKKGEIGIECVGFRLERCMMFGSEDDELEALDINESEETSSTSILNSSASSAKRAGRLRGRFPTTMP